MAMLFMAYEKFHTRCEGELIGDILGRHGSRLFVPDIVRLSSSDSSVLLMVVTEVKLLIDPSGRQG